MTTYRSQIVAHLTRHKNYPEQAQDRGLTGRNAITLTLSRDGRVVSSGLAKASGQSLLDSATLAAVRRAQPFPAIPQGGPATFTVTIAMNYDLR
jgi:periplasmic protein TonB